MESFSTMGLRCVVGNGFDCWIGLSSLMGRLPWKFWSEWIVGENDPCVGRIMGNPTWVKQSL